jgi:acyl transferase domain-containing protein
MVFEPIAIVGRSCLFPGASDPAALFSLVRERAVCLSQAPAGRWRLDARHVLAIGDDTRDRAWHARGGYVDRFTFDPSGFALPPDALAPLDPLVHWVLHTAREALRDASRDGDARTGLVLGNLSLPSSGMSAHAESVWLGALATELGARREARDRFMSGLPAQLAARALGLGLGGFALDAACASSLYAIEAACRALQEGRADRMLAGAVNRADDLFLHVGFTALGALSPSGRSRPFHAEADGLVPAEGCGFVVLERLADARRQGRPILGVIRGVGLANDGRGRGILAPSERGQALSMQRALAQGELAPSDVRYVECHATGTTVGDATELRSMAAVYPQAMPIGSLKANLGHAVTAAGVAGLVKLVEALRHGVLPPTPLDGGSDRASAALGDRFEVLATERAWDGPRRAALSAFGFGGNDAHLIVEAAEESASRVFAVAPPRRDEVVVVARAYRVGDEATLDATSALATTIELPLGETRFPPNDLRKASAQQTMLLAAALDATRGLELPRERTGVFVGYGCDPEIARWGARWRSRAWGEALGDTAWSEAAAEIFAPSLEAPHVLGVLPNMPANRLSSQLDLHGASFTVSAEEASGVRALQLACAALARGELDAAIVGAVDLSNEAVHRAASGEAHGADAAVVLVLRRRADVGEVGVAVRVEDTSDAPAHAAFAPGASFGPFASRAGKAHAAAGLLEVAHAMERHDTRVVVGAHDGASLAVSLVRVGPFVISPAASGPRLALAAHPPAVRLPAPAIAQPAPPFVAAPTRPSSTMQKMSPAPWLPPVSSDGSELSIPGSHAPAPSAPVGGVALGAGPAPSIATAASTAPQFAAPHVVAPHVVAPHAASAPAAPTSAEVVAIPAHARLHVPSSAPSATVLPPLVAGLVEHQRRLAEIHRAFLEQQATLHRAFLRGTTELPVSSPATTTSATSASLPPTTTAPSAPAPSRAPTSSAPPTASMPSPLVTPSAPTTSRASASAPTSIPTSSPTSAAAPAKPTPAPTKPTPTKPTPAPAKPTPPKPTPTKPTPLTARAPDASTDLPLAFRPTGPSFTREDLEIHASGTISTLFGELFRQQDGHAVQVRMPEPPLLLADRCTGMVGEPGSMKKGTCWTETDVRADSWYLQHDGHMPAGIMIESGQADLFLISYLGADFLNRGKRAYRLLGCEMTWLGDLPEVGDTLAYDIHVDGHANQGDIRLFFFHYDCWIRKADGSMRPALRVRNGQAGFFTRQELDDSAGILWKPTEQTIRQGARVDAPAIDHGKRSFSGEELRAFADGRPWECFGPSFERTKTHTRTPQCGGFVLAHEPPVSRNRTASRTASASPSTIPLQTQKGRMLFLDEVTDFDPKGGPWGRGYFKGRKAIRPDEWFFDGHFKNDPCMPGTLMLEGCVQAMAFYLSALGYGVDRDGWRFRPIEDETYKLLCRGQVIPESKELTYELFVEEVHDGPEPILYADLLCTVDGLGAFHARRFGLKLVPDWPLSSPEKLPLLTEGKGDPRAAIGVYEGKEHRFDLPSLVACAWGRPSTAFGPMYARFDGARRTPRLPGPPYHFLTRVTKVDGAMGALQSDKHFEFEYEVPEDVWYFDENGARVMPFAVLLEAALQPCGWIASYVGSTLTSESDLLFRNLDGKGTIRAEVFPLSGTLRTKVHHKSISRSAGMIIVSFHVECSLADPEDPTKSTLVYDLDTVFGFFPPSAFDNQAGLPTSAEQRVLLDAPHDHVVDLEDRSLTKYFGGTARLAEPFLLMIDRVVHWDPTGGKKGLGTLRAEKDIDAGEWFFKAHFYQDPVQPGSLGIEAMLQALQFHMLEANLHEGMTSPRFEAIAVDLPHVWKYRGQVVPEAKLVSTTLEVVEVGQDARGRYALADCSLWVDGKRIYEAQRLGMRLVEGGEPPRPKKDARSRFMDASATSTSAISTSATSTSAISTSAISASAITSPAPGDEVLSLATHPWLADHCPTHTVAVLPMMSALDRLVAAAEAELGPIDGLHDLTMERWVVVDGPTRTKTELVRTERGDVEARLLVWRDAKRAELSRFELAARAKVGAPSSFEPIAPLVTAPAADPYATDALFHGPAFHYLVRLETGEAGARAFLDPTRGAVPRLHPGDRLHQGVLDAMTHAIPHDALHRWSPRIGDDVIGYPHRLDVRLLAPIPDRGELRCEARFVGFEGDDTRFPVLRLQLFSHDTLLVDARLVDVLLPKGRLGSVAPASRRAFLRDGAFVEGASLSIPTGRRGQPPTGDTTILQAHEVRLSDWLPGTLRTLYDLRADTPTVEIAAKEHVARTLRVHPRTVELTPDTTHARAASTPLTRHTLSIEVEPDVVVVRDAAPPSIDVTPVSAFWREHFALGAWPVEDLYYALIERFVGTFHVADPAALAALRGRGVLYLGNHQVGIESLIFSVVTGALQRVPTLTLAKQEHRESWLGKLIAHCFTYPGAHDPGVIAYFDRSDPASLPRIAKELGSQTAAKSLMVHVEGTRSHRADEPVRTMSGIFCELAIGAGVSIVPVRFTGGLPKEPVAEKLEYPFAMGRQDYWLGAPIAPAELAALPYKARTERVTSAINALGPAPGQDAPFASDRTLEERVSTLDHLTGAGVGLATILAVLEGIAAPSDAARRLVEGARRGVLETQDTAEDRWLAGLARMLYGPRGAVVR